MKTEEIIKQALKEMEKHKKCEPTNILFNDNHSEATKKLKNTTAYQLMEVRLRWLYFKEDVCEQLAKIKLLRERFKRKANELDMKQMELELEMRTFLHLPSIKDL